MTSARKALLDTNLLLLWLAGTVDIGLLGEFKRVAMFVPKDIEVLVDIVKRFPTLVTTPHVLTETSNFVGQAPSWRRPALREALFFFISNQSEIYREARQITTRSEFMGLGLTDAGLADLSRDTLIVTADYALAGAIEYAGGHVINFNHYRGGYLLS